MFCLQMSQGDAVAAAAASVTTLAPRANPRRVARKFAIKSKRREKSTFLEKTQMHWVLPRRRPPGRRPLPSAPSTSVVVGELTAQEMARHGARLLDIILMKSTNGRLWMAPRKHVWEETPPPRTAPGGMKVTRYARRFSQCQIDAISWKSVLAE